MKLPGLLGNLKLPEFLGPRVPSYSWIGPLSKGEPWKGDLSKSEANIEESRKRDELGGYWFEPQSWVQPCLKLSTPRSLSYMSQ